jgi:putative phosphoesterase
MKILIISDIHGSSYYAEKIKEIDEREKPDQIILLGDLYYHGPRNDLTQEYNPMKVAGILNDFGTKLRTVRGNCDAEVDEMISDFKFEPQIQIQVNNKNVFFTHGHVHNMENIPDKKIDIMFYGHFHTGFIEEENGIIFANPGSISLPKNNTEHSYIIFDEEKITLKNVEGEIINEWRI